MNNSVRNTMNVVNIVGNFKMTHGGFNLEICCEILAAKLDEKEFPALIWRDQNTNTTVSLFENGKVNVTGGNTELISMFAVLTMVNKLRESRMYPDVDIANVGFPNYVAACRLGYNLNMEEIRKYADCSTEFEGPRLKLTILNKQVHVVCFESGHLNITGIKTREQIGELITKLPQHFERFRQVQL